MALFLIPNSPPFIVPLKRNTCFSYTFPDFKFLPSNPFSIRVPRLLSHEKKNHCLRTSRPHPVTVAAVQSNWFKVLQTAVRVGKDGIEAGTNMVPASVPRPVARVGVAIVAVTVALFVLNSFLSTAFFAAAMMGFIYLVFIALNKDEGPKGNGGTATSDEETLEEARRIMEKYK